MCGAQTNANLNPKTKRSLLITNQNMLFSGDCCVCVWATVRRRSFEAGQFLPDRMSLHVSSFRIYRFKGYEHAKMFSKKKRLIDERRHLAKHSRRPTGWHVRIPTSEHFVILGQLLTRNLNLTSNQLITSLYELRIPSQQLALKSFTRTALVSISFGMHATPTWPPPKRKRQFWET